MADSLMKRIDRDGHDVARRFLIERDGAPEAQIGEGQLHYLRGELAGLSRAAWYITGEPIENVEARWIREASVHFTVPEASRA